MLDLLEEDEIDWIKVICYDQSYRVRCRIEAKTLIYHDGDPTGHRHYLEDSLDDCLDAIGNQDVIRDILRHVA